MTNEINKTSTNKVSDLTQLELDIVCLEKAINSLKLYTEQILNCINDGSSCVKEESKNVDECQVNRFVASDKIIKSSTKTIESINILLTRIHELVEK